MSQKDNELGPDYFGFYATELTELLSQNEDFMPFADLTSDAAANPCNALFRDCFGSHLSDFKKERLKSLLRQCVVDLTQSIDEIVDPILSIHRLSYLRSKRHRVGDPSMALRADQGKHPRKKLKMSICSSDPESKNVEAVVKEATSINDVKKCTCCYTTDSPQWSSCAEGPKTDCTRCGLPWSAEKVLPSSEAPKKALPLGSNLGDDHGNEEVNDDLRFLLENDSSLVDEALKKHSDELIAQIVQMDQKVEELIDKIISGCRLMSLPEKHELQKMIKKLPASNLDRIAEIIQRNSALEKNSPDEINVDLEKQDKVMLWRLYFYVEAVENARRL